jgi:methyltransferase (TIGR00027 family)
MEQIARFDAVSETALITLKARVVEAEMDDAVIQDDVGRMLFNRLFPMLPVEVRQRVLDRQLSPTLTKYIALRARKYDAYTTSFMAQNPDGLVVSLGCGFDTRYWRVLDRPWNYVEVDLPELIDVKMQVLGDMVDYTLLGSSVLEEGWIRDVRTMQDERVLFLAEGLFMYLPRADVVELFRQLSASFSSSQIAFEVVNERYTRGIWKRLVAARMQRSLGSDAGASYRFGIRDAHEIETYGDGIKVLEEWSFLDDNDVTPDMLRWVRKLKIMTRTQWTVKAAIG